MMAAAQVGTVFSRLQVPYVGGWPLRQAEDKEQQTRMLTTGRSGWLVGLYASLYLTLVSMRLALH